MVIELMLGSFRNLTIVNHSQIFVFIAVDNLHETVLVLFYQPVICIILPFFNLLKVRFHEAFPQLQHSRLKGTLWGKIVFPSGSFDKLLTRFCSLKGSLDFIVFNNVDLG